jgi:hypothetical protein
VDVVSAAGTRFGRVGRLPGRVRLPGGRLGRRRHADARPRRPTRWVRHGVDEAGDDGRGRADRADGGTAVEGRSSRADAGCPGRRFGRDHDEETARRSANRRDDAVSPGLAGDEPDAGAPCGRDADRIDSDRAQRGEAEAEPEPEPEGVPRSEAEGGPPCGEGRDREARRCPRGAQAA